MPSFHIFEGKCRTTVTKRLSGFKVAILYLAVSVNDFFLDIIKLFI